MYILNIIFIFIYGSTMKDTVSCGCKKQLGLVYELGVLPTHMGINILKLVIKK